ncbi:MAG TPA: response regulator [Verrucomicrobiae bacterium]|nr:response regulator [Verrucomicrobiae bacterium]
MAEVCRAPSLLASTAIQPAAPARGKVLVASDNPTIQRAVYFALRDNGYKVLMAGEILDAINTIREEQPNLILLDLSFPPDAMNIGGPAYDVVFFIDWARQTPEVKNVPIMIISGSEPSTYKERASAAGVNVYFHKPLQKEALLAAVQLVLGEKKPDGQPGPA